MVMAFISMPMAVLMMGNGRMAQNMEQGSRETLKVVFILVHLLKEGQMAMVNINMQMG
jgi:hypothetical protein